MYNRLAENAKKSCTPCIFLVKICKAFSRKFFSWRLGEFW